MASPQVDVNVAALIVVRVHRPHVFDGSGIVQARRLHHKRWLDQARVFVAQPSRLPGGWSVMSLGASVKNCHPERRWSGSDAVVEGSPDV